MTAESTLLEQKEQEIQPRWYEYYIMHEDYYT